MSSTSSPFSVVESVSKLFERGKQKFNELTLNQIDTFHFDIVQGCQLRCIGCPNSILLQNRPYHRREVRPMSCKR